MTSISVIVPAHNEEATIVTLLERVRQQKVDGCEIDIVVVDDGSTDDTAALLDQHGHLYDQLVTLPRNQGKGAAVIAGLKTAAGEFVLIQDADLEYDPRDYAALSRPVLELGAEIVMGSRMLAPQVTRVHYFWHKVGNRVITLTFDLLFNSTLSDIYSGYLLFRKDLLEPSELKSVGWAQQAEILGTIIPRAQVIYEVPISYHGRTYGEGKKIKALDVVPVIWMIVKKRIFG